MADIQDPASQSVINWIGGVALGLLGVLYALTAWVFVEYVNRVKKLEIKAEEFVPDSDLRDTYATRQEITALAVLVAQNVSRQELALHMESLKVDRQRMHDENLTRLGNVGDDVRELRGDIRSVHERIDEVVKVK